MSESSPPRASATLGRTLRTVLVSPDAGFRSATMAADRRARSGGTPEEGVAPYVLAAAGGASLMITWLKLGGLLGGREVAPGEFGAVELVVALVAGAVLALLGQAAWSVAAPAVARALGGEIAPRDARIVWGVAAWPQVLTLSLLLPLDLLIVGRQIFATTHLGDSLATGWASLSVALCLLLGVWSVWLFFRGMKVVADLDLVRGMGTVVAAAVCLSLVVAAGSLTVVVVWG